MVADAGESRERAFAAAFGQIRERDYATELRERGASPIHEMVAVFEGKRVSVRTSSNRSEPETRSS